MLKIAVFGNRNITDKKIVIKKYVDALMDITDYQPFVILHGGAVGPQQIIVEYFTGSIETVDILFKPWHMLWSKLEFNPIFFYLRNKQIVENADKVIVFTNGEKDSEVYRVIDLCERRGKDLTIIEV